MNDGPPLSGKWKDTWEREMKIAEMIEEVEEQKRFDEFYSQVPNLIARHRAQESHLPLLFITSANNGK